MSWEDRDYAADDREKMGRLGGDWRGIRPTFDNPFTWALTMGRIAGILVRVHILFLIYIAIQILRALAPTPAGAAYVPLELNLMLVAMGGLFVIVLAHEFGHCLACRWMGGQADEILMWPLGGLAYCRPPHRWKAHLITVIGGPIVNVILCLIVGGFLWLITGQLWGIAIPNPLRLDGLNAIEISGSFVNETLFLLNSTSLILLLFNLLPVFPLDGGRIVQSVLWPRVGYSRSMVFAVRTGYIGAIAMGIFGAVINEWLLVGVAIFGGVTCYMTQRQLQMRDSVLDESDEYALSVRGGGEEDAAERPGRAARKQLKAQKKQEMQEQDEAKEMDRILQKIAARGLNSLTRGEKSVLKRVTDRKRGGSGSH